MSPAPTIMGWSPKVLGHHVFFCHGEKGEGLHLFTFPSPSGVSPPSGGTSRPNCSAPLRGGSSSGAVPGWPQVGHLLPVLVFCSPSPPVSRSASHPTAATKCEGPDGHPTLFGDVATGLGGAVRKNRAGDDGFHIKIYIYLFTRGLTPTVPSK